MNKVVHRGGALGGGMGAKPLAVACIAEVHMLKKYFVRIYVV